MKTWFSESGATTAGFPNPPLPHWKDWSWSSNVSATCCKEQTHWKRPWCWERVKAGREGDNRGWEGWMASQTQRTWVWASSGRWWRTGKPGMLQSVGSQRVRHNWATEQQPLPQLKGLVMSTQGPPQDEMAESDKWPSNWKASQHSLVPNAQKQSLRVAGRSRGWCSAEDTFNTGERL